MSGFAPFALSGDLDLDAAAVRFAVDGRVRIPDVLTTESAEAVHLLISEKAAWGLRYCAGGIVQMLPGKNLAGQSDARIAAIEAVVAKSVAAGERFTYVNSVHFYELGGDAADPANALGQHIAREMNRPEMLALARRVSGIDDIDGASANITLHRPGHFLTRHNDEKAGRRVAFVLSLCAVKWRSDWGGYLLFYDDSGDVSAGYRPTFNQLTLFRVPQMHSVSPVASSAPHARIAISGWFHGGDGPAHARADDGT